MESRPHLVVGLFNDRHSAEMAYRDLRVLGYREDQIGLAGPDVKTRGGPTPQDDNNAEEGLGIGAATGAAAGAAVGWAVLTGAIPVIGPAIAAGTLGVILSNALAGAAVAGIAGALIGWGIPEDEAKHLEQEVQSGRYLVTVDTSEGGADPHPVLYRHGGVEPAHV